MATRGTMGGLARGTADLVRLMDAAGKDYVIVETVGVGQDEVEITSVVQVTVVVLVPGMGDDVQAIKAGIMEIADIFVVNKSDRPGADRVELELHAEGFACPILHTVATEGKGIAELVEAIEAIRAARGSQAEYPPGPPAPPPIPHTEPTEGKGFAKLVEAMEAIRAAGGSQADSPPGPPAPPPVPAIA